jgi:uncharacterized protein (DUF169 family)
MRIQQALGLARPPVAIGFFDTPPANVSKWDGGPVLAGCTFWREAMNGKTFYTEPSDHYNCAVGSYTHGIALPAERAAELQDTVGFMVAQGYIEMAEVPGIPALSKAPAYIAYGPAEAGAFAPDVVVVAARPASAMLLYEAALRAGAGNALTSVLGRPGCAVLPLARKSGAAALSFGCKGNRTFTGLGDDELYAAIPGAHWAAVAARVEEIVAANRAMEQYYRGREAQFPIL